jgi:hypothetical protein
MSFCNIPIQAYLPLYNPHQEPRQFTEELIPKSWFWRSMETGVEENEFNG